jgi:fructose-bisphosphate aldolase class II
MPLVDQKDLLDHAHRHGYAVAAFDVSSFEGIAAAIAASEQARAPVILVLAESHFGVQGFAPAAASCEAAARRATVPVAIQCGQCTSYETAVRGINLGCNGLLLPASHERFTEQVAAVRRVTDMARACGVAVEAGWGQSVAPGGVSGPAAPHTLPTPEEARAFVERTQVDCLTVPVCTSPGGARGRHRLDADRLKRLRDAVNVPLAVSGGLGLSDEQYHRLIALGVSKMGCPARRPDASGMMRGLPDGVAGGDGYAALLERMRAQFTAEAERCQRLFGAAGRAAEVLAQCRPWRTVEHTILYNTDGLQDAEVEALMARGREVLSRIPGVRRVASGRALTGKPQFRYCWLIEFAHPKVIESYRDHPDHVEYANRLFRPVALDRLSTDYQIERYE